MPLSPLQLRVLRIVAEATASEDVGLAGGAALLAWDIGDRLTRDLDFFATAPAIVDAVSGRVRDALLVYGLSAEIVRESAGFVRMEVSDDIDVTELDIAWDARIRDLKVSQYGAVLDRDELAADKMLALYGRAEARDFVDVFRLLALYSREQLGELAFEKDRGFVLFAFAESLRSVARRDRFEFDCDDSTFDALIAEFADWRSEIVLGTHQ